MNYKFDFGLHAMRGVYMTDIRAVKGYIERYLKEQRIEFSDLNIDNIGISVVINSDNTLLPHIMNAFIRGFICGNYLGYDNGLEAASSEGDLYDF